MRKCVCIRYQCSVFGVDSEKKTSFCKVNIVIKRDKNYMQSKTQCVTANNVLLSAILNVGFFVWSEFEGEIVQFATKLSASMVYMLASHRNTTSNRFYERVGEAVARFYALWVSLFPLACSYFPLSPSRPLIEVLSFFEHFFKQNMQVVSDTARKSSRHTPHTWIDITFVFVVESNVQHLCVRFEILRWFSLRWVYNRNGC